MRTFVNEVARRLERAGGYPLLAGECVRDSMLGIVPQRYCLEAYQLSTDDIGRSLSGLDVDTTEQAFGVFRVRATWDSVDVVLPGCTVDHDFEQSALVSDGSPRRNLKESASGRTFTVDSLARTMDGTVIDFFDGLSDLTARRLRLMPTVDREDVDRGLHVLDAMRVAARCSLDVDDESRAGFCELNASLEALSPRLTWSKFSRLMLEGGDIRRAFNFLKRTGCLSVYPELNALDGCAQELCWHPEGDALQHSLHVCNAAAQIANREHLTPDARLELLLAALLHDLGKAVTTKRNAAGRLISPGHAAVGVDLARSFLERIGAPKKYIERVLPLVAEHMFHHKVAQPSKRTLRRLARRLQPSTVEAWERLVRADYAGRPPLPPRNPVAQWGLIHREMQVPQPILRGRHLIAQLRMEPGPHFKPLLDEAYRVQKVEGWQGLQEAMEWARAHCL